MDLKLTGKSAIVMASSRGMGRAIALRLAEEGANVAMCARGREALEQTAAEAKTRAKGKIFSKVVDVSQPKQTSEFIREVTERFGGLHVLVNNTGGPPPGMFADLPPEAWLEAVQNLLLSVVHICREAMPTMKAQKWGRIINITSIAVKQPIDNLILSNTVRTGLVAFAKSIAREVASHNITVNNIAPGLISTERITELAEMRAKKENLPLQNILDRMQSEIPMGRFGTPEEVAHLAAFLASDGVGYITGNTLLVDGGLYRGLM